MVSRSSSPEMVASLHDETLRLGVLVADLETMTSADAASFTLQPRGVDLAQVVAAAAAPLEHRFTDHGLGLVLRLGTVSVLGDETRLRQVITNLLTNALKFVPSGGTVTVSTGVVDVWAELEVSDDGPGIPPAQVPHVFERFYRGPMARASGSGIGLAVVAALVTAHGGHVDVISGAQPGATFRVRLPRADATVGADPQPASMSSSDAPASRKTAAPNFIDPSRPAPTLDPGRRHPRFRRGAPAGPTTSGRA